MRTDARLSQVLKQTSKEFIMMTIDVGIDLVDLVQPAPPSSMTMIGHFPSERKTDAGYGATVQVACPDLRALARIGNLVNARYAVEERRSATGGEGDSGTGCDQVDGSYQRVSSPYR